MKLKFLLLGSLAISGCASLWARPPIEYSAAIRNAEGKALINQPAKFEIEIVDAPVDGTKLYAERHSTVTSEKGMATIFIGEGSQIGTSSFDDITWTSPRFLSIKVDVEGTGSYRDMGVVQLMGAPTAAHAESTDALTRRSPSGQIWQLTVDNIGNLSWQEVFNDDYVGDPAYDQSLVPENLYFIGTFNNWDINNAVPFEKLSKTRFRITRNLEYDEIFKFTSIKDWTSLDWSGVDCNINVPNGMKEYGNTPEFKGQSGEYVITVDFYTFTLTITKK